MHMLSNKERSSSELDTLGRSRNSTVEHAANGEVHTNEEAQVHVHDLDLRDSANTRRNACSVYRLENSAKNMDIPCEWDSGKQPRLTKEGKTIVCKTDNFVPLVVPGLSASSGSNSSTTSISQDSSSTSSSPATERSDELAP